MKHMFLAFALIVALPLFAFANGDEDAVRKALDAYDQAVAKKTWTPSEQCSPRRFFSMNTACATTAPRMHSRTI